MSNARDKASAPASPVARASRVRLRLPLPLGINSPGRSADPEPLEPIDDDSATTNGRVPDALRSVASVPGHLGKTAKGALTPARNAIVHASHSLTPRPAPEPEPPVLTASDAEILRAVQQELQILARTVRDRRIRRRLHAARECLNEVGKETKSSGLVPRLSRNRDSLARLQHVRAVELQRRRNPLHPLRYPGYMKFAISKI
ncbi:hypothetical protein HT102_08715 [Hoyosella sp. G463]|uniref:Uncharacterized protein n=1 Tax=Lolliginicoccus lacisalsi TaxID=2742202 RepID=A0A927JCK7_9ACTN|nr:hypothetical protein [Lolliginicoccus lacisalsi]MBD8506566.1 hypothetical protein [Lolliginicoccus lacisalsi]